MRDGNIVKVQQAADYPDKAYNPRGCMKGISYHLLHPRARPHQDAAHPRRRARLGNVPRGDLGRGPRSHRLASSSASATTWGWDTIHVFGQVPGSGYIQKGANYRACAALGMTHGTSFDFNGDLPMGMPITFGVQNAEHEAKDWANSRFILLIGANPLETRIPDVHFIHDAVEKGARLVVVDPTFSSTASKADAWLQIKPGTDAALGLALCRQVIADGNADCDFMRTYTDAALLVRADTGKRLRADELAPGEAHDPGPRRAWASAGTAARRRRSARPRRSRAPRTGPGPPPTPPDRFVAWDTTRTPRSSSGPSGWGSPTGSTPRSRARSPSGSPTARTVEVTPGFALVRAEVDGWTPERAAEITGVPAEQIVAGRPGLRRRASRGHHHGRRRQPLVPRRPQRPRLRAAGRPHRQHRPVGRRLLRLRRPVQGPRRHLAVVERRATRRPRSSPASTSSAARTDTMNEKVPYPKNGFKALFCTFANMFLQAMDVNRLHQTLDGCELVVVVDHQMTDTANWADIVLPATTWYEKTDLTATPLHPFLQIQQAAIPPVGESRSELWMWQEIVKRIDPAIFAEYFNVDRGGGDRGDAGEGRGGPTEGITLDQLKAGPVRLEGPGPRRRVRPAGRGADAVPAPVAPGGARGDRRLHPDPADRVLQGGGPLPRAERDGPDLEGAVRRRRPRPRAVPADAALAALEVADPFELRQRGLARTRSPAAAPPCSCSPETAAERGIADGDLIEITNTRGMVRAWAHVTEAARPGTATLFEGWWSRQLGAGKSVNELTSSAVNPIHEIHYVPNMWAPSTGWKDCRCEVKKVDGVRPR